MQEIDGMSAAMRTDGNETSRISVSRQQRELLARLHSQYDLSCFAVDTLDRTGLMRLADTFDFLANNLPPNSLVRAK